MIRKGVDWLVDLGGRRPYLVMAIACALLVSAWSYASKLQVRSDILELLPRDSPGFQAFEKRLARVGGNATIIVVVESPHRVANEKFVDAMRAGLENIPEQKFISAIESDTKEVRGYFRGHKWLFADLKDLEEADTKLDHQIAIKSGLVSDLTGDDEPKEAKEKSLGMGAFKDRFEKKAKDRDEFPSGYFANAEGTELAMRIFTTSSGLGGGGDDALDSRVRQVAADLNPATFDPQMKIGFGGDIPNAKAEKDALVHEALVATVIAAALILGGIVFFYGSPWSLVLVGFPPIFGVGCAYAFATWKFGYVNASGAFLGAIIIGNGVNYPIVLYSRYKEFLARGMSSEVARREAVWNAFRAELVGASVGSIAYGSLTVTRFRGFSQFGLIGFVGMILVWISMIPCVPALIVIVERLQKHMPRFLQEKPARLGKDESRGLVARVVGDLTERYPWVFVGVALAVTATAASRLPGFLKDPWEYDFDKLGSEGARKSGAFQWSKKADAIFSHKMNLSGSLVMADRVEQVPEVKAKILAHDAADPKGAMIEGITTAQDLLPGDVEQQRQKLEVLDRIRDRLSPGVLAGLSEEERVDIQDMIPPETLKPLGLDDLPTLLKRRFSEKNGTVGSALYVRYKPELSKNDGHNLLRMSSTIDGIVLDNGTRVETVSRASIFAEMIRSMERDGPLATGVAFGAVAVVVILATASFRGALAVLLALLMGVVCMLGGGAFWGERLNFLNFIALPITFGIGAEYPFNIYDRSRLLGGDVTRAVKLHLGAVTLCSYTTTIGYGSLLFADNQALRSFGRLAISGEIACLLATLFFLPALLHLIGAHRGSRGKSTELEAAR